MWLKRGQVTIFLILGILLLILLGVTQMLNVRNTEQASQGEIVKRATESLPQEVETLLQSCVDDLSHTGLRFSLLQSGQYNSGDVRRYPTLYPLAKPIDETDYELTIERNPNYAFSKADIENSVEEFVSENVISCLAQVHAEYPESALQINTIRARAGSQDLTVDLSFTGKIEQEESVHSFSPIQSQLPINVDTIISVVNHIVQESVWHNQAPFERLLQLEQQHGFWTNIKTFPSQSGVNELVRYELKFEDHLVYVTVQYDWSVGEHS